MQHIPRASTSIGWAGLWIAFLFAYVVSFGGTGFGELIPLLFIVNAALATPLVIAYLRDAPVMADRADKAVLIALLLFLLACVLSQFPRQSFDSALAVLAYAAAFFVVRGYMADRQLRRWMTAVLIGLSAALTIGTVVRWLAVAAQWMSITDWSVMPPLNLELPSEPWGHRHDLALLVAMLYPAWWRLPPSRIQRALALGFGVLAGFVVVFDGSRTLWIAMGAATIVIFGRKAWETWRRSRVIQLTTVAAVIVLMIVALGSGFAGALVQRLSNLSSLGFRTTMWSTLLDSWSANPISGLGPGSFPWLLQGTGYFDTNSFAPRHPDNAPLQLLAEGGLLGIAALAVLLVVILPLILRERSRPATWALVTFVVASLASNPTDFAFMVAPVVVWAAIAIPREATPARATRSPGLVRVATFGGAVLIAAVYLASAVGAMSYLTARNAIGLEDIAGARPSLDMAIAMDPGMALYARERGTLSLSEGQFDQAHRDLVRATALNPSDSVAWRLLALTLRSAGDGNGARDALERAIDLRRSDASSLLLQARWDAEDGNHDRVLNALAEVVHAWPDIVGAAGWDRLLEAVSLSSPEVLATAAQRWADGEPIPETVAGQGVWLAVLADRPDLLADALDRSGYDEALWDLTVTVLRCEPASDDLSDAMATGGRLPLYWGLVLRDSALIGAPDEGAKWALRIMTGEVLLDPTAEAGPSDEPSPTTRWGYRRGPVVWPVDSDGLPSPEAGRARWLLEPTEAVRVAGLEAVLPGCASG